MKKFRSPQLEIMTRSPWGEIQTTDPINNYSMFVSTAGHGGIIVCKNWLISKFEEKFGKLSNFSKFAQILKSRVYSRNFYAFEEDCDVFLFYLINEDSDSIHKGVANWFPHLYEELYNIELLEGESYLKDEAMFKLRNKDNYQTLSAIWSEKHPGFTEVTMCIGGRKDVPPFESDKDTLIRILVPKDEYKGPDYGKFVVKPENLLNYQQI